MTRIKHGRCIVPKPANCRDCDKPITQAAADKTGCCIGCGNKRRWADPEYRERRMAGIRRKCADPVYKAQMRARASKLGKEMAQNEEVQAKRRAASRLVYQRCLASPEAREKNRQAVMAKSGPTLRARWMAWCPVEYWGEYRYLRKTKHIPAAEARAIILATVEADKRKALAKLSPFERQELALKRGAKLVANDTAPSLTNPANYGEERWSYGR